jgi:spore maturation protein B
MQNFLSPILNLINIPEELTSLILLRPISGSGSLLLAEEIMREHGVDTLIGRSASVMAGSCETFFYVLALYFGVTSVKKMRHAFIAGLIGYLIGVLMSVYICMII